MSGGVTAPAPARTGRRGGFAETALERRGIRLDLGAPVTAAVAVNDTIAASFGDGTVRIFRQGLPQVVAQAHRGAILTMVPDGDYVLTGGHDGRCLRVSLQGQIEEIADFGTKWVDCVAAHRDVRACSSGRAVHVWFGGAAKAITFEHPSTVGGLAIDAKGKRLAVAHYGGITLWERGDRRWKSSKLVWKGSHGMVTFSPDGKFLVSAMQENALHGWRLRDKIDMQMGGYPAKIKSFAWVGTTPHLATSGADEAICWPFDGKEGPLGRAPLCVAHGGKQLATVVQTFPGEAAVLAGFQDGAVLLGELDDTKDGIVLRGSTGTEVTAIAVTASRSHILIGDAQGYVLWAPLSPGEIDARPV
ncbi:MAG: WD40 repeat domain-containing protein [Pseudomonadota bacterium]